jgi:hypothetical protein
MSGRALASAINKEVFEIVAHLCFWGCEVGCTDELDGDSSGRGM